MTGAGGSTLDVVELRHGYTLQDLESLANLAAKVRVNALPFAERRDVARSAIAEAICGPARLEKRELASWGMRAIQNETRDIASSHGYRWSSPDSVGARFAKFWFNPSARFEDQLVERIATKQIMAGLPATHRESILMLAAHGSISAAAAAAGIRPDAMKARIHRARWAFITLWNEGESVGIRRATDTVCSKGHPWAVHGRFQITREGREKRRCDACEAHTHSRRYYRQR